MTEGGEPTQRILVLGTGMFGHYLHEVGEASHLDLHFASRSPRPWKDFHVVDILDREGLRNVVKKIDPEVVINTAVYGNIAGCERDPDLAFRTNRDGQRNVISVCNELGVKVVYISTNSVFCGKTGNYTEEHIPHPGTVYGRSKLSGEEATKQGANDWAIFRITALFGDYPDQMDFVRKIIHELSQGRDFQCWDQIITPTYGPFVAQAILELVDRGVEGIWHIGGIKSYPRHEIGKIIERDLREALGTGNQGGIGDRTIGTIACIPTPHGLPLNRSFSVEKLKRELPELEFPDFVWTVKEISRNIEDTYSHYTSSSS